MPRPILIVEDNEDDLFTLKRALRKVGVGNPVDVARDGRKAIDYLAAHLDPSRPADSPPPLFVLLDLKLPYKNGFEVLEWIRAQPSFAELAVVMLTGSDEARDHQRAYALGARSYLVKPASADDLKRLFESLESHWQKVDERPLLGSVPPSNQPS